MCGYFCIGLTDFMFADKTLTDFTRLIFVLKILKKMTITSWVILKMSEIINSNLSKQAKFRLNEINKIKDYFNSEIQERKIMSKKLNKYIAAFDYTGKNLIVLSAASGGVSRIFFCKCYWCSRRNSKCRFYFLWLQE